MNTAGLYDFNKQPLAETVSWLEGSKTTAIVWRMLRDLVMRSGEIMSEGNSIQATAVSHADIQKGNLMTSRGEKLWNQAYGVYRVLLVVSEDAPQDVFNDLTEVGHAWFWAIS